MTIESAERVHTPATSIVHDEMRRHTALLQEIAYAGGREEPPATVIDLTQGRFLDHVAFRIERFIIGANAATDFELVIGSAVAYIVRTPANTLDLPFPIDIKGGVEVYIRSGATEPPNIAALRGAYLIGYAKARNT